MVGLDFPARQSVRVRAAKLTTYSRKWLAHPAHETNNEPLPEPYANQICSISQWLAFVPLPRAQCVNHFLEYVASKPYY